MATPLASSCELVDRRRHLHAGATFRRRTCRFSRPGCLPTQLTSMVSCTAEHESAAKQTRRVNGDVAASGRASVARRMSCRSGHRDRSFDSPSSRSCDRLRSLTSRTSAFLALTGVRDDASQVETPGSPVDGHSSTLRRRSKIPLPPLPEQRRIAEILDKADALRAKRRAALAQLDTLTQSIFLDMFGDPATNPKGWPTRRWQLAARDDADGDQDWTAAPAISRYILISVTTFDRQRSCKIPRLIASSMPRLTAASQGLRATMSAHASRAPGTLRSCATTAEGYQTHKSLPFPSVDARIDATSSSAPSPSS